VKRSRVNAVSSRKRKRDAVYPARRREVWERGGGVCEWCGMAEMQSVHHIEGRRVADPHALHRLIGLCEPCHRRCHAEPEWARSVGLMRSRLQSGPE
jgi:5-methylcytosine-specific restriction endonuclease McrA